MVEFLHPDWILALDEAASAVTIRSDTSIVIEQTVARGPGAVTWHVTLSGGRMRVTEGPAVEPDIRLESDAVTAAAIAAGRLSAQRAFLHGHLRLTGDVAALMAARAGIDALADAFADVRRDTTGLG